MLKNNVLKIFFRIRAHLQKDLGIPPSPQFPTKMSDVEHNPTKMSEATSKEVRIPFRKEFLEWSTPHNRTKSSPQAG